MRRSQGDVRRERDDSSRRSRRLGDLSSRGGSLLDSDSRWCSRGGGTDAVDLDGGRPAAADGAAGPLRTTGINVPG